LFTIIVCFNKPQGAGVDVARLYIDLAFVLFFLNCLQGGIGGGVVVVPYNVYWNIGPNCPSASRAIGIRILLLQSKSPISASPGTCGSALVLVVLLSFFLSKS
jgi:hypothetical protein